MEHGKPLSVPESPLVDFDAVCQKVRAALEPARTHAVSLHDEAGEVLWLSESSMGPDEHNAVRQAVDAFASGTGPPMLAYDLGDSRSALLLRAVNGRRVLAGLAMVVMDTRGIRFDEQGIVKMMTPKMQRALSEFAGMRPDSIGSADAASLPAVEIPLAQAAKASQPSAAGLRRSPQGTSPAASPARAVAPVTAPRTAPVATAFKPAARRPELSVLKEGIAHLAPVKREPPVLSDGIAPVRAVKSVAAGSAGGTPPSVASQALASSVASRALTAASGGAAPISGPAKSVRREAPVTPEVDRLHAALRRSPIALHVQRLVPLTKGSQLKRYEVLLRSGADDAPDSAPQAMLKAAVEHGLGSMIDRRVVTELISWLVKHPDVWQSNPVMFSVNLTTTALHDEHFMHFVGLCLAKAALPKAMIAFEIDVPHAVKLGDRVSNIAKALQRLGCPLVLDDFGLRTECFDLLRLPAVRYIKLAPEITAKMRSDKISQAAITAVVQMARVLGMHTVAKRTETPAEQEWLTALGVDFIQSNSFAPPSAIEALSKTPTAAAQT